MDGEDDELDKATTPAVSSPLASPTPALMTSPEIRIAVFQSVLALADKDNSQKHRVRMDTPSNATPTTQPKLSTQPPSSFKPTVPLTPTLKFTTPTATGTKPKHSMMGSLPLPGTRETDAINKAKGQLKQRALILEKEGRGKYTKNKVPLPPISPTPSTFQGICGYGEKKVFMFPDTRERGAAEKRLKEAKEAEAQKFLELPPEGSQFQQRRVFQPLDLDQNYGRNQMRLNLPKSFTRYGTVQSQPELMPLNNKPMPDSQDAVAKMLRDTDSIFPRIPKMKIRRLTDQGENGTWEIVSLEESDKENTDSVSPTKKSAKKSTRPKNRKMNGSISSASSHSNLNQPLKNLNSDITIENWTEMVFKIIPEPIPTSITNDTTVLGIDIVSVQPQPNEHSSNN